MPRPTIRPAQGSDFPVLQAMVCSGDTACYPSFSVSSHAFFVAQNGHHIVGFICARPTQDGGIPCVQMLEPLVYNAFQGQGVENDLKAAVLEWAEKKLKFHFFKENPNSVHPIKPHQYLESLKYDGCDLAGPREAEPVAMPVSQAVKVQWPQRAYG